MWCATVFGWELGWEAEGSQFEPQDRPAMQGDLVVGGGARTPSERCLGTLEQGPAQGDW